MRSSAGHTTIVVLGMAPAAPRRAHQLRLRGYATWVATSEDELRWLLEVARVRPDYSVVDLDVSSGDRAARMVSLAKLASMAGLPVVLIGSEKDDEQFFSRVFAMLPRDPASSAIIRALAHS